MPCERTQAVLRTRELLKALAFGTCIDAATLQHRAEALLRDFPTASDLDISAAALPGTWARIDARRSD
ncbi:BPSL0761 family protein [Paraburkholderia lycopersici]|uniref:BPSL0761 family protein n=1 Tax=Paraburkholderia lycopersici TaxID=416944 RepID=UPI0031841D7C